MPPPRRALLLGASRNAFTRPTPKQKEAYGRFCHTLSAAALIGGATVALTEEMFTLSLLFRISIALIMAGLLFVVGAVFFKDRKWIGDWLSFRSSGDSSLPASYGSISEARRIREAAEATGCRKLRGGAGQWFSGEPLPGAVTA